MVETMEETKSLLESKTVWSDILTIVVAILPLVDQYWGANVVGSPLYTAVLAFLGSLGIYGRITATTRIAK